MGHHVEIFAKHISDADIIARFRVRQLRVAVLVTSARRYCDRACMLVSQLISYFVKTGAGGSDFLEKYKSEFHELWQICSASAQNVTINF